MAGALIASGRLQEPSYQVCVVECGGRCCKQRRFVILSHAERDHLVALNPSAPIYPSAHPDEWGMDLIKGPCVFLTPEGACGIHAQRPAACRAFPQRPARGCLVWPKAD